MTVSFVKVALLLSFLLGTLAEDVGTKKHRMLDRSLLA